MQEQHIMCTIIIDTHLQEKLLFQYPTSDVIIDEQDSSFKSK